MKVISLIAAAKWALQLDAALLNDLPWTTHVSFIHTDQEEGACIAEHGDVLC